MELTSAVRSVSYKSDMNKCNGNLPKSNESENTPGGGNKVNIINILNIKSLFITSVFTLIAIFYLILHY